MSVVVRSALKSLIVAIFRQKLALAIARLFSPGQTDFSFRIADRQALTSLLTFLGGAFLGRIGDKMGAQTRAWLCIGTFIQTLFTMAAALAIWKSGSAAVADDRGDPSWTNTLSFVALGFASATIGLQGIMGKRVNTQFATTGEFLDTYLMTCRILTGPISFLFFLQLC